MTYFISEESEDHRESACPSGEESHRRINCHLRPRCACRLDGGEGMKLKIEDGGEGIETEGRGEGMKTEVSG